MESGLLEDSATPGDKVDWSKVLADEYRIGRHFRIPRFLPRRLKYPPSKSLVLGLIVKNVSGGGRRIHERRKWTWRRWWVSYVVVNLCTELRLWIRIINRLLLHNLDMLNSSFVSVLTFLASSPLHGFSISSPSDFTKGFFFCWRSKVWC